MRDLSESYDDEVINNPSHLTVGYFTAPWCGPCRMLKPRLEELETENQGLTVVRVDVESHPEVAADMRIMSVPTLFFYTDGQQVGVLNGIKPKKELQEFIDKYLGE